MISGVSLAKDGLAIRNERVPLLLDTDIGSDIDDAVALAYLLRQPLCELIGITTVSGDTAKRAALCDVLCHVAGNTDIPIHAGIALPLLHGQGQPDVPQFAAVANRVRPDTYPQNRAVDFLRDTIRSRPHEITLLAIGPLTNIAALFAADPEIPALLKQVVMMVGVYKEPYLGRQKDGREWNALVDPVATAIVFDRFAKSHNSLAVGLDVTTQCTLPADECRHRFRAAGGALGVVAEMAEVWFRHSEKITFHDPLAAALIFEPELCGSETGLVRVRSDDNTSAGRTDWQTGVGLDFPHRIATTVQTDAFFAHYFAVTGGESK